MVPSAQLITCLFLKLEALDHQSTTTQYSVQLSQLTLGWCYVHNMESPVRLKYNCLTLKHFLAQDLAGTQTPSLSNHCCKQTISVASSFLQCSVSTHLTVTMVIVCRLRLLPNCRYFLSHLTAPNTTITIFKCYATVALRARIFWLHSDNLLSGRLNKQWSMFSFSL